MWRSFRLNVKIVHVSDKLVHFGRFLLHLSEQLIHFVWKTLIQKTTSPAHLREALLSLKAAEAGADGLLHGHYGHHHDHLSHYGHHHSHHGLQPQKRLHCH